MTRPTIAHSFISDALSQVRGFRSERGGIRPRSTGLPIVLIASMLSSTALAASTGPATLPATAGFPESITAQPGTDTFFVSSFTTGAVFRGRSGQTAQQFLTGGAVGRSSAAGVKFDGRGRLMVIGGTSPAQLDQLQIFSSHTGRREATFRAPARDAADLNDMALSADRDVYITDFASPAIYRVTARQLTHSSGRISRWLSPASRIVPDLAAGGNFNGIAATADGRYLIVGQTGNGALWRINLATRSIRRISVSGGSLLDSDGILLLGDSLYVATHDDAVVRLALSHADSRARVVSRLTAPSLDLPTSVAVAGDHLLVSNGAKPAGAASFTVTSFALPR